MIASDAVAAGVARGEFTWWAVQIFGRGQGTVITEMRATQRTVGVWTISAQRTLRVTAAKTYLNDNNFNWPKGDHPMNFDDPVGCLMLLAHDGYTSFQHAQAAAITSYVDSTREITKRMQEHVDENALMIGQLLAAGDV